MKSPRFLLNRTLATNANADPDDLVNVKKALSRVGLYPQKDGFNPITDDQTFDGIRMLQATNGLTIDGRMSPGGPTETRLRMAQSLPTLESRSRQLPIPKYVDGKIRVKDEDWRLMHDAVDRTNLGFGQRRSFLEIYSAEGGTQRDATDHTVVAGLSKRLMAQLSRAFPHAGLPASKDPQDLTPAERLLFYQAFFRSRDHSGFERSLGDNVLDRIGDEEVAASIADVVFRRGGKGKKRDGGVEIVQQALNNLRASKLMVDGRLGNATMKAIQALTADPTERRRLLNEIATVRIDKLDRDSPTLAGERSRAEHFRFSER